LRGVARSAGVSVASLIHLAWAMVLARVSGCDDVVFGTLMFGRMQGDHGADRALGMFINLLPLRVQLADHPVRVCLRETHDRLSQLMRHEHAALSLAQQCSGISESSPLFVAVLNYRHAGADVSSAEAAAEAARAWAGIERLDWQERTIYPVNLLVDDHADGFSMTAQVDATLDPQQLCALMQTALESLVGELTDTAAEGSARAAGAAIKCRELLAEETGS
jgi:non-ribosomal peptide synthetase component F